VIAHPRALARAVVVAHPRAPARAVVTAPAAAHHSATLLDHLADAHAAVPEPVLVVLGHLPAPGHDPLDELADLLQAHPRLAGASERLAHAAEPAFLHLPPLLHPSMPAPASSALPVLGLDGQRQEHAQSGHHPQACNPHHGFTSCSSITDGTLPLHRL
jgi:hypothetical protein